jgi:hypothetical protein
MGTGTAGTVLCQFEIQGELEAPETRLQTDVELMLPVTLESLKKSFPFMGEFHFRQKVVLAGSTGHCWLDLVDSNEPLKLTQFSAQSNQTSSAFNPPLQIRVLFPKIIECTSRLLIGTCFMCCEGPCDILWSRETVGRPTSDLGRGEDLCVSQPHLHPLVILYGFNERRPNLNLCNVPELKIARSWLSAASRPG